MLSKLIGPAIGIAGFIIVGMAINGWWTAMGIFIMLWGNNIERSFRLNSKLHALYKMIIGQLSKTRIEM